MHSLLFSYFHDMTCHLPVMLHLISMTLLSTCFFWHRFFIRWFYFHSIIFSTQCVVLLYCENIHFSSFSLCTACSLYYYFYFSYILILSLWQVNECNSFRGVHKRYILMSTVKIGLWRHGVYGVIFDSGMYLYNGLPVISWPDDLMIIQLVHKRHLQGHCNMVLPNVFCQVTSTS